MNLTIAFLLSKWSENIYGTFDSESEWKSYAFKKMTQHRYYRTKPVLPIVGKDLDGGTTDRLVSDLAFRFRSGLFQTHGKLGK
jgi:hypothetical protein